MYNITMKKLGIILDSFAGRDKKSLDKDGIYYLPHSTFVEDKAYLDGITITYSQMNKYAKDNKKLKTSLPSPERMISIFTESSKEYDDVLYLTMGSAISGTFQSAHLIARDFKNIHIMDNQFTGPQMYGAAIKQAQDMYAKGKKLSEIISVLKKWNSKILNLIIPINLNALHQSGRIGKSGAFLLNKAKIIPIMKYDSQIKVKWFKRTQKKAIYKAILLAKAYAKNLKVKCDIFIGHVGPKTIISDAVTLIQKELGITTKDIHTYNCSAVVTVHVGYGAISISVAPKKL